MHTSPGSGFCHAGTDIMAANGPGAAVGMSAERQSCLFLSDRERGRCGKPGFHKRPISDSDR